MEANQQQPWNPPQPNPAGTAEIRKIVEADWTNGQKEREQWEQKKKHKPNPRSNQRSQDFRGGNARPRNHNEEPRRCFRCMQEGHMVKDCPQPPPGIHEQMPNNQHECIYTWENCCVD
ncbi:zinc finger protein [Macleaya cordata]|uniref:Zinc finger protein n=1 Tax=Macleaya cordata TaxID=56857 RepID=A0A200QW29_MACCD|nr:zinc finger protein [Macleaya cordata]